jgi:NAD(P)-dependent dehydrogenase (short-subunit alcohol dehydrogenase family)
MDLDSKRLVLTGASSSIGWALLRQLSRLPVQVVAVAREGTRLREAVDAAGATQARILPFPCDLARQEEVDRLFAYAVEQMGGIDVFFAHAGFAYWERIESIFQTNVYSPIYAAQKMEALFPESGYRVVITSSVLGRIGLEGYGLYAATKAALDRFAEVYRLERGKRGQLVLVYPLAVRSGFFRAAGGGPVPWLSQSPEAAARAVLRGIKKGREAIYTSWILPPMLLVHHLLPFTRRWYQALDGRVQQRHWTTREKGESVHECWASPVSTASPTPSNSWKKAKSSPWTVTWGS